MDEYLKTLLEQIRCKKARPYVKQEFQDHIEDQIEAIPACIKTPAMLIRTIIPRSFHAT